MSDKLKGYNTGVTSNIKTFSSLNNSTSTNSNTYIQSESNNNKNVETLDLNINASQEQIEQSNNNQSYVDDSTKAAVSNAKSVIVDFFNGVNSVYNKINAAIYNVSSYITKMIYKPSKEELDNLTQLHKYAIDLKNTLYQLETDLYSKTIKWGELENTGERLFAREEEN